MSKYVYPDPYAMTVRGVRVSKLVSIIEVLREAGIPLDEGADTISELEDKLNVGDMTVTVVDSVNTSRVLGTLTMPRKTIREYHSGYGTFRMAAVVTLNSYAPISRYDREGVERGTIETAEFRFCSATMLKTSTALETLRKIKGFKVAGG